MDNVWYNHKMNIIWQKEKLSIDIRCGIDMPGKHAK